MDWVRKHFCDLAGACLECAKNASLSPEGRDKFSQAFIGAKIASVLPKAGGTLLSHQVLNEICSACRFSAIYRCDGRVVWEQKCQFLDEFSGCLE